MFEKKYSKALTITLVVSIIAIVGLLGFLGYELYQKIKSKKRLQVVLMSLDKTF